jgi:hypothetical protein
MSELPVEAWEKFLADGDGSALLARLRAIPTRQSPRDVSYPAYHRICDVDLGSQAFRVSRLVDLDDGMERLFIEPTDTPDLLEPGVPYWLRGQALSQWIREEETCPSDDKIDWESYRSG